MAAGEFYIAHNTKTDEYLAEKLFRGFYMTPDVTNAVKCKDEMEMKKKLTRILAFMMLLSALLCDGTAAYAEEEEKQPE